jgi:hypothetical protein
MNRSPDPACPLIKVFYKYDQSGGDFSATHTKTSTAFKCVDGKSVLITVK